MSMREAEGNERLLPPLGLAKRNNGPESGLLPFSKPFRKKIPFLLNEYALVSEGAYAFANAVQTKNLKPGAWHLNRKESYKMKNQTLNRSAGVSAGLVLTATIHAMSLSAQAQVVSDVTVNYSIQDIALPPNLTVTEIFGVTMNDSGTVAVQCNAEDVVMAGDSQGLTIVREKGVWTAMSIPNALWIGCGNPTAAGSVPLAFGTSDGNVHNALYRKGNYTFLPDYPLPSELAVQLINDHSIMTGVLFNPTGQCFDPFGSPCAHGVVMNGSLSLFEVFDYPGAIDTYPLGINNALKIVGDYFDSDSTVHSFFSDGGKSFVNIDPPGAAIDSAGAWMINNGGEICGIYTDAATGIVQGYLLRNGVFSAFRVPGSTGTSVNCITDNGYLSGSYVDENDAPHAFIATPRH
jgi:hypothetical protein